MEQTVINTTDKRRFWTIAELAAEARVGTDTVLRWLRLGMVPGVRVGRGWRIPADAAEKILSGGFSLN